MLYKWSLVPYKRDKLKAKSDLHQGLAEGNANDGVPSYNKKQIPGLRMSFTIQIPEHFHSENPSSGKEVCLQVLKATGCC